MLCININMMGIFQDYFSKNLIISVPEGTNISNLKDILIIRFKDNSFENFTYIICRSIISNDSFILSDDYILSNNENIYLLPPFSGG